MTKAEKTTCSKLSAKLKTRLFLKSMSLSCYTALHVIKKLRKSAIHFYSPIIFVNKILLPQFSKTQLYSAEFGNHTQI